MSFQVQEGVLSVTLLLRLIYVEVLAVELAEVFSLEQLPVVAERGVAIFISNEISML